MIAVACVALAVLALDEPPAAVSTKPCAPTLFAGAEAFLVVRQPVVTKEREAISIVQRARASKLEATVIDGRLFEKLGGGYWVVYGAFASEEDAKAKVAALAKRKFAASVVASGPPVARAPAARAPIVRVCGDARREEFGGGALPASDTRFSRVPVSVDLGDAHYVTETNAGGYFELWLKGWGRAHVQIEDFKVEPRDKDQRCGFIGRSDSTPAISDVDVDLPKQAGASVRTRGLAQSILGCGE